MAEGGQQITRGTGDKEWVRLLVEGMANRDPASIDHTCAWMKQYKQSVGGLRVIWIRVKRAHGISPVRDQLYHRMMVCSISTFLDSVSLIGRFRRGVAVARGAYGDEVLLERLTEAAARLVLNRCNGSDDAEGVDTSEQELVGVHVGAASFYRCGGIERSVRGKTRAD